MPGSALNYEIVVTNNGPSDATGVAVEDTVPDTVTVSGWTCTATANADCGTTAGNTNQVQLSTVALAKGASITIAITGTAKLSATGDIVNQATATLPTGVSCTTAPCNQSSSVTNSNGGIPALRISKTATPVAFAVGQTGVYSITAGNAGTSSTNGLITVTDAMPAGITINTPVADNVVGVGWVCTSSTATQLNCTFDGVLLPGSDAPVINAQVSIAGSGVSTSVTNTASVTGGGTSCTTAAPCQAPLVTTVNAPHLDVTKALNGNFVVDQPASYTITVTNNGQSDTLDGTISDDIPAGLTLGTLPAACTASGQLVTCAIPKGTQPGASLSFTIPVTPQLSADGKTLKNTAMASSNTGDASCPTAAHCKGTTDNPVRAPQLTLTKSASAATFTVGQVATYRLVVRNTGTEASIGAITITDTVPADLTIDASGFPAHCAINPAGSQTVKCTVDSLAVGASFALDIPVTPQLAVNGRTVVNQATVTGGGDPLCTADTVTADLPARCAPVTNNPVNAPQLKIEKSSSTTTFSVGVPASYVLKVTNIGTAPTNGVITVSDVVAGGLTLGTMPAGCTAQGQQVTCKPVDVLQVNDSVSFTIDVTPTITASPSVSNTAKVLGGGDFTCPNTSNCTSTIITAVDAPSLQLSKADNANGQWIVGEDTAAYTLTVKNASATVPTIGAITVKDAMPLGIAPNWTGTLTSGNWSCTFEGQNVNCVSAALFSIAANTADSITLPVTVADAAIASGTGATVTNYASVAGGGDPFNGGNTPMPGSACAAADATSAGHCAIRSTQVNTPAGIQLLKRNPTITATSTVGQYQAEYVVTVSNTGGVPGVYTLSDTPGFPATGVALSGWTVTTDTGSLNPSLVTTPVNNTAMQISASDVSLAAGGVHTYTVRMTFTVDASANALACNAVTGNGAFNEANITGSSKASSVACNALPGVPNLGVTKSSNGPWVVEQVNANYLLTVTNSGTVATTGTITLVDEMPAGITPAAGKYGEWSCTVSGQTVTCTSSAVLAAGGASSVTLPVTVADAAIPNAINNAAVGGGGDPFNGGNVPVPGRCTAGDGHCASQTTGVTALPGLGVVKTNNLGALVAGSTTVYTVTISNTGATPAEGVSWSDVVGSGLSDVVVTPGAASNGSVIGSCTGLVCSGITVASGGSVTYMVNATVSGTPGMNAVNTAVVTGGACKSDAPCTSVDSDPIVHVTPPGPGEVTPVPVDSRTMLALLAMFLMAVGLLQVRRAARRK